MSRKTWALIFKAPALTLLIAAFLAGVYAASYDIQEMGWEVPIILGSVILLYTIGSYIENNTKEKKLEKELEDTGFGEHY